MKTIVSAVIGLPMLYVNMLLAFTVYSWRGWVVFGAVVLVQQLMSGGIL